MAIHGGLSGPFTGSIPSGVWKLQYIELLYFHNNELTGPLDEWIKGTVAWEVRVDGNQLDAPLLRHGKFSKIPVDLKSVESMREYLEERLKQEGGDIKLWGVDRLRVCVDSLRTLHPSMLSPCWLGSLRSWW